MSATQFHCIYKKVFIIKTMKYKNIQNYSVQITIEKLNHEVNVVKMANMGTKIQFSTNQN